MSAAEPQVEWLRLHPQLKGPTGPILLSSENLENMTRRGRSPFSYDVMKPISLTLQFHYLRLYLGFWNVLNT
jgi:hypothetical protein